MRSNFFLTMRFYYLILSAFALLSTFSHAAEKTRTCRGLFLARPANAPEKLFLHDGTNLQEIELGSMSFSPIYPIAQYATSIAILTKRPANPADPVPNAAPRASIPADCQDFYLILTSDPKNTIAPVKLQIINANATQFGAGKMLWFNLTEHRVLGKVGERELKLGAMSRLILDAPISENRDYAVSIYFVPSGQKQPEPLCETRWIHDPRSRSVLFVMQETGAIAPRIIGIPDFREQPN
jgi:hypothetical protein